jgi:Family of unknown function (DUF6544)
MGSQVRSAATCAAIAPGTPLATAARLRMRGHIKIGRWLPFRAEQTLSPHRGFQWTARAAGVVAGFDRYAGGQGQMRWKLLGLLPLMQADGPDVSRSAAGRAAAEAIWVPTALLPRFGVDWSAADDRHISARCRIDTVEVQTHYQLDADGRVRSVVFDRWGDPDATGTWGLHPFGGEVTAHATFSGLSVPSAGRFGWFFGTDRWSQGEFFRYRITELQLIGQHSRPQTTTSPWASRSSSRAAMTIRCSSHAYDSSRHHRTCVEGVTGEYLGGGWFHSDLERHHMTTAEPRGWREATST